MVGGFSNDHAVRSGTNLQLCSRCLNVVTQASGISIQGVCRRYRLFYFIFCMRLIRLHYQENCEWPSLKCRTTRLHPLIRGRHVSLPRALHRLQGGYERHFRLAMDIYVHPGIIKEGIQRKHISILWVGKEEQNVQTRSFSHEEVCRLTSVAQPLNLLWHAIKENGNHQNDFLRKISIDD